MLPSRSPLEAAGDSCIQVNPLSVERNIPDSSVPATNLSSPGYNRAQMRFHQWGQRSRRRAWSDRHWWKPTNRYWERAPISPTHNIRVGGKSAPCLGRGRTEMAIRNYGPAIAFIGGTVKNYWVSIEGSSTRGGRDKVVIRGIDVDRLAKRCSQASIDLRPGRALVS